MVDRAVVPAKPLIRPVAVQHLGFADVAVLRGSVSLVVQDEDQALGLAARYGVEMPITEQMDAILHHNKNPKEAIRDLMSRPGREE